MWPFKRDVAELKRKKACRLAGRLAHEDARVRKAACEALVGIGADAVVPLCAALRDGRDAVRTAAADTLGIIGDAAATEALCAALEDGHERVREAAANALGRIGDLRGVEALCKTLKDYSGDVRKAAARALEMIGIPSDPAVQAWHAVATDEWDRAISFGDPSLDALCVALTDSLEGTRKAAAHALGEIGDARAVQALSVAVEDRDPGVSKAAARALAKIGAAGVEPLCHALESGGPVVRVAAARALGQIGSTECVKPLCRALRDESDRVRKAASQALEKMGEPSDAAARGWYAVAREDWDQVVLIGDLAVEPLCTALKHESKDVRKAVVRALADVGSSGAVDALVTALRDPSPDVACAAAKALGQIRDCRSVTSLLVCLASRSTRIRVAASEAIAAFDDASVVAYAQRFRQRLSTFRKVHRGMSTDAVINILGSPTKAQKPNDMLGAYLTASASAVAPAGWRATYVPAAVWTYEFDEGSFELEVIEGSVSGVAGWSWRT